MKTLSKIIRKNLGAQSMKSAISSSVTSLPYGYEVDNSLAEMVKEFDSAIVFTRGAKLASSSGIYHLDIIYGMSSDENDIRYRNQIYLDRIPKHTYTFGESPEGDQFCINSKTNKIYCWKHDAIDGSNTALLASSFIEFIKNLVADEMPDSEALEKSKNVASLDLDF